MCLIFVLKGHRFLSEKAFHPMLYDALFWVAVQTYRMNCWGALLPRSKFCRFHHWQFLQEQCTHSLFPFFLFLLQLSKWYESSTKSRAPAPIFKKQNKAERLVWKCQHQYYWEHELFWLLKLCCTWSIYLYISCQHFFPFSKWQVLTLTNQ